MKKFRNYCSVFASIIVLSNNVYAQDSVPASTPAPAPTESVTTPSGASSVVNIFPIQAPQTTAPVAQQPMAVPGQRRRHRGRGR